MSEIRKLAMRLAMESGFMLSTMHGQDTLKAMPVTDADTAEALVRAAMREAYARTIAIAGDSEHEAKPRGHYDQLGDSAQTRWNIEAAIRAEADKLEGK